MSNTDKYDAVTAALSESRITVGPATLEITAVELRRLRRGSAYIGRREAGIVRDGEFHASVSDAVRRASVMIAAPETDAERETLRAAAKEWLRDNARPPGSAYDPIFAAAWDRYRAMLAAIE